jgi:hypothetical protein
MRCPFSLKFLCIVGFIFILTSCILGSEHRGPFNGKVVDVETGQPIAGAVVLVVWWEVYGFPFTGERFYDAREAVTDTEGNFQIPRLPMPWKLGVQPPVFYWVAQGYDTANVVGEAPEGKKRYIVPTLIEMRKLETRQERVKFQRKFPPSIPFNKMPIFLKALNEERSRLGLQPLGK